MLPTLPMPGKTVEKVVGPRLVQSKRYGIILALNWSNWSMYVNIKVLHFLLQDCFKPAGFRVRLFFFFLTASTLLQSL